MKSGRSVRGTRVHARQLLPLIVFCAIAVMWIVAGPNRGWQRDAQDANARAGFAATTSFEFASATDVVGATGAPGATAVTYHLDPNRDSYKAKDRALKHLKSVTLISREGWEASPFVFDLYLHGALSEPDGLAVRVPALDIRKFFAQVVPFDDENVARLQAYFEEFSRKSKLIYGERSGRQNVAVSAYERIRLDRIGRELDALAAGKGGETATSIARLERIRTLLRAQARPDLAAIEENLRLESAEPGADLRTQGVLQRALETLTALGSARKINYIRLVNNCREPGNFEISLDDWLGRPALRGSFAFAPDLYDRLMTRYFGLGIREIGTGIRISHSVAWSDPVRYWRAVLPWNWLKRLPRVEIQDLIPGDAGAGSHAADGSRTAGAIEVAHGRIPYEDYEIEVRAKSAFQTFSEPLSYVTVEPSKAMPSGFEPPDGSAPAIYWTSARHAGQIVAHKFVSFDDLQRYQVHLSGFEVNGVYIGKSDLVDDEYDLLRKAGRWAFDYSYLTGLERFEAWEDPKGLVWIRLGGGDDENRVKFLIGNLRLRVGEVIEYPFGIGTQPLVSDYDDNVYQDVPRYALAYGRDGAVLDHHATDVGVERVYVERVAADAYKLRLVAHERIMPVWEGVIRPRIERGTIASSR